MYCPQCSAEYIDDVTECSDCHVPLVPGRRPQHSLDPALELVGVFESGDRMQLAMAKGLLEDAGIPIFVQGQLTTLIQGLDGLLGKWIRLQVPRDRESEARDVLEQLLHPVSPEITGGDA
jgi:hypothetical protein